MSKVDDYKKAKRDLGYSESWLGLIGRPYHGGGGGVGKVSTAYIDSVEIYHQEYNGAKNYWEMPEGIRPYLDDVLKAEMPSLIAKAIAKQRDDVIRLADCAAKELQEAMADAGLEVPK